MLDTQPGGGGINNIVNIQKYPKASKQGLRQGKDSFLWRLLDTRPGGGGGESTT